VGIGAPLGQPLFKPVPTTVVTTEQLSGQMAIGGPSPTLVDVQQSAPPVTPGAAAAPLVTAERPDHRRSLAGDVPPQRARRREEPGTRRYNLLLSLGGVY